MGAFSNVNDLTEPSLACGDVSEFIEGDLTLCMFGEASPTGIPTELADSAYCFEGDDFLGRLASKKLSKSSLALAAVVLCYTATGAADGVAVYGRGAGAVEDSAEARFKD